MDGGKKKKTNNTKKRSKTPIILKNYQNKQYKPEIGARGGWHNVDITLPSYIPNSQAKISRNRSYLEMPDQIMQYGNETQKGLVICIWKIMQESGESSTFDDVTHENHPLYRCTKCEGLDFECRGYRYQLKELREYNQTLK